jgi:hypothetical protein
MGFRSGFAALLLVALLGGCKDSRERLQGTWERIDYPGQTVTFEGGRMLHAYPHGGKPISGPYDVVVDDGDGLLIAPSLELGDGRSLRADRQRILFVDDATITMKNAKNGSGGTYKRRE